MELANQSHQNTVISTAAIDGQLALAVVPTTTTDLKAIMKISSKSESTDSATVSKEMESSQVTDESLQKDKTLSLTEKDRGHSSKSNETTPQKINVDTTQVVSKQRKPRSSKTSPGVKRKAEKLKKSPCTESNLNPNNEEQTERVLPKKKVETKKKRKISTEDKLTPTGIDDNQEASSTTNQTLNLNGHENLSQINTSANAQEISTTEQALNSTMDKQADIKNDTKSRKRTLVKEPEPKQKVKKTRRSLSPGLEGPSRGSKTNSLSKKTLKMDPYQSALNVTGKTNEIKTTTNTAKKVKDSKPKKASAVLKRARSESVTTKTNTTKKAKDSKPKKKSPVPIPKPTAKVSLKNIKCKSTKKEPKMKSKKEDKTKDTKRKRGRPPKADAPKMKSKKEDKTKDTKRKPGRPPKTDAKSKLNKEKQAIEKQKKKAQTKKKEVNKKQAGVYKKISGTSKGKRATTLKTKK